MKKTFSILLALALVLALSATAFAADVEPNEGSAKSQEVTANYSPAVEAEAPGTVYNVTITWTKNATANLAYDGGSQATYVWDAEDLQYKISEGTYDVEAGWSGSTGYEVTVTNRSNADVNVKVTATNTYDLDKKVDGEESTTLIRADKTIADNGEKYWATGAKGTATSLKVTYTYSATDSATAPENASGNSVTVGTITVSLS